jgi:hypothetical protein
LKRRKRQKERLRLSSKSCQPFDPEPFGNKLKAELLTVEGLLAVSSQPSILTGSFPPVILMCLDQCFIVKIITVAMA